MVGRLALLVTVRVDQRRLRTLPFVVGSAPDAGGRRIPEVHSYRYALPGDANVPTVTLIVVDRRTRTIRELQVPPLLLPYGSPERQIVWTEDGRYLFVGAESRDFRTLTVYKVDPQTGASREVLVDRNDSGKPQRLINILVDGAQIFAPVGNGRQLVLFSQRDGREHLYLYDVESGKLVRRLTSGAWSVVDLTAVDARDRVVFFSAAGREPGRDPYLRHFYRVSLDGGQPVLLTPEDADHEIHLSPKLDAFVDVYSTLSQAPRVVLRKSTGALISELWRTDPRPWYSAAGLRQSVSASRLLMVKQFFTVRSTCHSGKRDAASSPSLTRFTAGHKELTRLSGSQAAAERTPWLWRN